MTREELLDRICVMLGGRAAEDVVFGDVSTGAQNDLERVAETARQMVCRFGMSAELGPLAYGRSQSLRYLDGMNFGEERNFSEATAQAIDREVRSIVDAAYGRAKEVLQQKKQTLEAIAHRLLEIETLERTELESLVTATR
jgi:cell division protease FtsH